MIGRALSVVLVSVLLVGAGCTRQNAQPRARSATASPAAAKRAVTVAPRQPDPAPPSAWTAPAATPSSPAPVRRTAQAHPPQPAPPPRQDETLYPTRTRDGHEPLWRQRARTY